MKRLFSYIKTLRLIPAMLCYLSAKEKANLDYERDCWLREMRLPKQGLRGWLLLMNSLPAYRSLFYFRVGKPGLAFFARGQNNLEFFSRSEQIGWGLVIWHGFSTVINVKQMGRNCQVWQNVTIGKGSSKDIDDRPIIGDGVLIAANACVCGPIQVADHITVGAGAVVVKDIPEPHSIVVGQPSRIITKEP